MRRYRPILAVAVLGFVLAGCVSNAKYNSAIMRLDAEWKTANDKTLRTMGRRTVALESAEDLERFVRSGGRAIIVKASRRDSVSQLEQAPVRAEARHGRRRHLLLELSGETIGLTHPAPPR